jgi:hypothetical protein
MEKNAYLTPQMRTRNLYEDLLPLCSSKIRGQGTGGANVDLGYGGVDESGTVEPSAKKRWLSEYDDCELW